MHAHLHTYGYYTPSIPKNKVKSDIFKYFSQVDQTDAINLVKLFPVRARFHLVAYVAVLSIVTLCKYRRTQIALFGKQFYQIDSCALLDV